MDNSSTESPTQNEMPSCPVCKSAKKVVKAGFRKTAKGLIQRHICRKCGKYFVQKTLPHTSYPPKIIFSAISTYNLGHTLEETIKITNSRFKTHIPKTTLHSWLSRYKAICNFLPLRKKYQIDPKDIIFKKKFHHQQVYEFKYHKLKLNILGKQYPSLKAYLKNLPREIKDKTFQNDLRCSDFPFELNLPHARIKKHKTNNATRIAGFGLELAKTSRERHQAIENFFLTNDSATVAVEIPVFLTPKEAKTSGISIPRTLTGHIDLIQVRENRVHILDYKPDESGNVINQLQLYAKCLKKRTGLSNLTCAYFDEDGYFEFTPYY